MFPFTFFLGFGFFFIHRTVYPLSPKNEKVGYVRFSVLWMRNHPPPISTAVTAAERSKATKRRRQHQDTRDTNTRKGARRRNAWEDARNEERKRKRGNVWMDGDGKQTIDRGAGKQRCRTCDGPTTSCNVTCKLRVKPPLPHSRVKTNSCPACEPCQYAVRLLGGGGRPGMAWQGFRKETQKHRC